MRFSITSQRKGEGESNLMETDEVMPVQCRIRARARGAMMQTELAEMPGLPLPFAALGSTPSRRKARRRHAGTAERPSLPPRPPLPPLRILESLAARH